MNKPKPGDWHMTVEILASGQPRAYADSYYYYRVTFEQCSYIRKGNATTTPPNDTYEPVAWVQSLIEPKLRAIKDWNDNNKWPGPRLDFIKNIEPGVWEFRVIEDFTD